MSFEYKCVGGPERPKKQRGVRGRSERVALAMQEIVDAEAVDGWEYLRTDLVPVEEKAGFLSRTHEVHRAVLVFRRERGAGRRTSPLMARDLAARSEPGPVLPEPEPEPDQAVERENRDGRIPLSADRDTPPPRPKGPPSGLG